MHCSRVGSQKTDLGQLEVQRSKVGSLGARGFGVRGSAGWEENLGRGQYRDQTDDIERHFFFLNPLGPFLISSHKVTNPRKMRKLCGVRWKLEI